jgi:hypothetical protein
LAQLFTNIQHRRLVTLAFSYNYCKSRRKLAQSLPHGFSGSLVGCIFVTFATERSRGNRGLLDDPG